MDLNKKLEELKPYQLNCNVFDVYSYNGLTMQDLLCQFFTKINECIHTSNETIDLAKWLVNEGLEIEVVKKLMIWLEDGTLENIINVNLFNTLNEKINGLSSQLEHKANEEEVLKKWSVSPVSVFTQFNHDYVFGLENLFHLHMKVGKHEECKVIFSGDSTTFGYGLAEPNTYAPSNIFKYTCDKEGLFCVKTVNKGQSGMCTEHWNRTFVQDEIIENPDCIVLRWGINDPSYDNNLILLPEDGGNYDIRRNANDFKISLESGLQKLRNWKGVPDLTIILMTPNATSTDLSFRNESWHESINQIIRDLARKYKCVFIDTYRYLQDVRQVPFMDIIGDGHIHPLDMMNIWINDLLFDTCFKRTFIHQYTEFGLWKNLDLLNGWTGDAQFKWVDYNTVELRGLISGGDKTPLTIISNIPQYRISKIAIKTISTEVGFGCLNIFSNNIRVGNFYDISTSNWVSLDGVRIYFE